MNVRKARFYLYHWEQKTFLSGLSKTSTVGRGDADFNFPDDTSLSRKHCQITWNDETFSFFIMDLGSRNGTRLNGKLLAAKKEIPINDGDWLKIGGQDFFFTLTQTMPDTTRTSQIPGFKGLDEALPERTETKSKLRRTSKVMTSSRMIRKKP